MTISHLLPDFNMSAPTAAFVPGAAPQLDAEQSETIRLEAYEEGYKAGWDDAIEANQEEKSQISADLAQNLKDLSFTYHEAASHIRQSLDSVLSEMSDAFLPEFAQATFAPKVQEIIEQLPFDNGNKSVILCVSPANLETVEKISERMDGIELELREDNSLADGQVAMEFDKQEYFVDFSKIVSEFQEAIDQIKSTTEGVLKHG